MSLVLQVGRCNIVKKSSTLQFHLQFKATTTNRSCLHQVDQLAQGSCGNAQWPRACWGRRMKSEDSFYWVPGQLQGFRDQDSGTNMRTDIQIMGQNQGSRNKPLHLQSMDFNKDVKTIQLGEIASSANSAGTCSYPQARE